MVLALSTFRRGRSRRIGLVAAAPPTDSLLDLLLRPLHLDLAIGRSGQVGEHDDLAWHLVPREACAHPVLQLGLGHEMRAHSDDGGHLLAPCRVRGADDNAVVDSRVLKKHVFYLWRVHLLPAGVDDPRVASEEADGAVYVDQDPVAGHGVSDAVDHTEGRRGLRWVLVVAQR